MRVAVVGASGNVGTAVLRALAGEPAVTEVVALARRLPGDGAGPYRGARWVSVDVGAPTRDAAEEEDLLGRLTAALAGADAVVHLVWAIQPNHDRDYLRRVNVEGTRRVAQAAARAGARQLVAASSWAAYSPADDDDPRPETWPTGGMPTSHYSVDKAAQERVLDTVAAAHPEMVVTRMRTALVFQGDAGAEVVRYFLGPLVPLGLLRPGRLPVLPLPRHLRLQIVHADDAARAYVAAVTRRAGGAFNVAAADTLWPRDLARILDHGRLVELPPRLLRPLLHAAWRSRAIAADAGWLDMAMAVPLMDTTRVRTELGWAETRSAESALREMVAGMADRRGTGSPAMRPAETRFGGPEDAASAGGGRHRAPMLPPEALGARIPEGLDGDLLGLYLSDHLTGATAGLSRITRMAQAYADTPLAEGLARVAAQIAEERELLRELIHLLGVRQRPYRQAAAWAAEHLGRLKLNQRVLTRSPMSPVLELELMRAAVMGKLGVWQVLAEHAGELHLPRQTFEALADQARDHAAVLDALHATARLAAFRAQRRLT